MYTISGKNSLHALWGDFIVYRNLAPVDVRLPAFGELRGYLGLESERLPRKSDGDYGRVVAELLRLARLLEAPRARLERLIFIGDTRLLDGSAFRNLCAAGGWDGWAFIGRDDLQAPASIQVEGRLFVSNRWASLVDFIAFLERQGFGLDEHTALVIDMDKTAVGARGRNDGVIDEARLEGVRRTVSELLGEDFDEAAFRAVYQELNKSAYHPFTADNQDYLAYICLMLSAGLMRFDTLLEEIKNGGMRSFDDFIHLIQGRRAELRQEGLATIHAEVWANFQAGDPTPFKTFRYQEYLATAACFGGRLDEDAASALKQWAVITQEVIDVAVDLRQRGVLIFGLSDKPDEASLPNREQEREGMKALHRLETLCVRAA